MRRDVCLPQLIKSLTASFTRQKLSGPTTGGSSPLLGTSLQSVHCFDGSTPACLFGVNALYALCHIFWEKNTLYIVLFFISGRGQWKTKLEIKTLRGSTLHCSYTVCSRKPVQVTTSLLMIGWRKALINCTCVIMHFDWQRQLGNQQKGVKSYQTQIFRESLCLMMRLELSPNSGDLCSMQLI